MSVDRPIDKKRHHLPAASIGYFSAAKTPARLRERKVWVLRKDSDMPRLSKAGSVGLGKKIYGYGKGKYFDFDDYFKAAEKNINQPVDRIMASDSSWIDANDWVKLAWYITMQITRNPDLEREVEAMVKEKGYDPSRTGVGYPLNAQRTSTAVARARWEFLWSPDRDFILGDRVITGTYYPRWKTNGYFIPLRKNFGVLLGPAPHKKQLKWFSGSWHIDIAAYVASADFTDKFNLVTWHAARQEVYGSSKEQLIEVKASAGLVPESIQAIAPKYEAAQLLGLDLKQRMDDEMLLLSLAGGIKEPEDKSEVMYLSI